jgi:hypothetical protein
MALSNWGCLKHPQYFFSGEDIVYKLKSDRRKYQRDWYMKHKESHNKRSSLWRENNAIRWKNHVSRQPLYRQAKRYGLSVQYLQYLKRKQKGLCALGCGRHLRVVDHDHKTGEVRKLLCAQCNLFLGLVENNKKLFQRMFSYLGV